MSKGAVRAAVPARAAARRYRQSQTGQATQTMKPAAGAGSPSAVYTRGPPGY